MVSLPLGAPDGVWTVRGATLLLWALLMLSVGYWGLKLFARGAPPVLATAAAPAPVPPDPVAVARLLGWSPQAAAAGPAAPPLASRFVLTGVVAGTSRGGAALIAVDGKPARPFRVGAAVAEGVWLQSVEGRKAMLATTEGGPAVATIELPPLRR